MRPFITCCLLLFVSICYSQSKPDTAFLASARSQRVALYDGYIKGQSRLYNGTEYRDYLSRDEEHPYFGVDDWSHGSIVYDDEAYHDVDMFYDISRDKIITEHALSGAKIELVADKISKFVINGHPFVRLHKDPRKLIVDGFYEVLYDGKLKVYARREKYLNSKAGSNTIEYSFEEKNRVYLLKDGIYHPVRSKGALLDLLKDRKQELRSNLNKNKIKFRQNREVAIVNMAQQYDLPNN